MDHHIAKTEVIRIKSWEYVLHDYSILNNKCNYEIGGFVK